MLIRKICFFFVFFCPLWNPCCARLVGPLQAGVAQVRAVDFNKAVAEFAEMVAAGTAASLADPGQFADAMRSRRRHNSQPPFVPPTDGDGGMSDGSDADSPPGDDQGFSPAEGHATDEL